MVLFEKYTTLLCHLRGKDDDSQSYNFLCFCNMLFLSGGVSQAQEPKLLDCLLVKVCCNHKQQEPW